MTDLKNFELYFLVDLLKADNREFRQDSDQLVPEGILKVCVLLPREAEYVYNLADVSLKELSGEEIPAPVLTPAGLAYVKNMLESGFTSKPKSEGWADDEAWETEKKLNPEKDNSTWNDPDFEDKPDVETWDDGKETWE